MWLGAAGCASRQPDVQRDDAGLDAEAHEEEPEERVAQWPSHQFPARSAGNAVDPAAAASVMNAAIRQPVPTCDMTRYR